MEEKVKSLISKPLEALNVRVDSVCIEKDNLNIVLDSDEVIDLNKIVEASTIVNKLLDDLREKYLIDVSSKEKGGN